MLNSDTATFWLSVWVIINYVQIQILKKNKQLIFGLFIAQFKLMGAKNIFCYLSVALKENEKKAQWWVTMHSKKYGEGLYLSWCNYSTYDARNNEVNKE